MSKLVYAIIGISLAVAGCGDESTEADRIGVGAECVANEDCPPQDELELECLTQFKGGYCGRVDCNGDEDCPEGSACVTHQEDGQNYCFRECLEKPDCNQNRTIDNAANCVGSIDFVDPRNERKACEPPSAGS